MNNTYKSLVSALVERAEQLGWDCEIDNDDSSIEFAQASPAGEDFSFCAYGDTVDEIVKSIREYADDFDTEDHVKMWLDAKESGVSGVPSVVDLVEDAKAIKEMLDTLAWDDELCGNRRGRIMDSFTLRKKITDAKAEYQKSHGELGWRWRDEGLPYAIQDYHSSKGSLMDFTKDDWEVCRKYGWTLDEVCKLCNEGRFCEDVDNRERYIQAVRSDDSEAGVDDEFLALSREDAIALVEDFYTWREKLLPVVKKVYSDS